MMSCACVIHLDTIYSCQWAPTFVELSNRPLPSSVKWQLVGQSAVPIGVGESYKGLSYDWLADLHRSWPCARACVKMHGQVAPSRLSDIPPGLAEGLMMTSPIIANVTLYRKTKRKRLSTHTRVRTNPLYTHTIVYCPTLVICERNPWHVIWSLHQKNEAMRLFVSIMVIVQNSYYTRLCVIACSARVFCVTYMYL